MRPKSIQRFDLFYLGSLAVSVIGFFLSYDALLAQVSAETAAAGYEMGSGLVWFGFLFGMALSLLLWFLVSRKRVGIAKWIIVLLFLVSLRPLLTMFSGPIGTVSILNLLAMVLTGVSIYFLFQPDAKAWFGGEQTPTE